MNSGDIGLNVKHYCYRIEFQARGMPHIHGVLWLEKESIEKFLLNGNEFEFDPEEVPKLIDTIKTCSTNTDDTNLNDIVREVQVHHHTKSCRKGKQNHCRFGYPKPPSKKTIIAAPLPNNMNEEEKREKLKQYKEIMTKVKSALESPNLNENQEIEDFLDNLKIDHNLFQQALAVSERGRSVVLQ